MNILIIGSGAREHAIATALHRSQHRVRIFCCGAAINPGIHEMAIDYWVGDINDVKEIVSIAQRWQIDMAIIGPEAPLAVGLADALWAVSIPTIGPKKNLAQIESSKTFARNLMLKHNIPGLPRFRTFKNIKGVNDYIKLLGENNYVVKANGLMGGKGVKVGGEHLPTIDDALTFCEKILSTGQTFVIEEKLIGQEFSLMCFCDGIHVIPMPVVQDHKRAFVGDKGPNTGGMGSYSDKDHSLPFLKKDEVSRALKINQSIISALTHEVGDKYIGILYGGFIATQKGVYVIEFNARFGDPEALNVLTILKSDFVDLCQSLIDGNLSSDKVRFSRQATVCKYAVPEGYPDNPLTNVPIDISAVKNKNHLYLSAVNAIGGTIYALGSRTAAYVGVADNISAAEEISEKEMCGIGGPLYHREDIGTDKLIQQRIDAMRRLREL